MPMYEIIQPPFTLEFREMSKQELTDYGRWFHASIPERLAQLEKVVRATPGHESWAPTYEPDSLDKLGDWFAEEVETRPRTESEMAELHSRSPMLANEPSVELTNRTFSLAIDVGMYLARVMERAHPQLVWEQDLKRKKYADYGQPVLSGFGRIALNPVRVVITTAYRAASGDRSGGGLRETFDWWTNHVATSS